jgi:hypothetical protein
MGLFTRKKRETTDDPSIEGFPATNLTESDEAAAAADTESHDDGPSAIDEFDALIDREWGRLSSAGTWWTGGERVAIANDARLAAGGQPPSGILPTPVEEATRRIAASASGIRGTDVARWELEGLDSFAFIEMTGIVSRLMAIDVACFGLGRELRPLPDPEEGDPTRERPDGAAITTGWAPTIGPASAPSSLTAVPPEAEAMFDVHGVLYATMEQMFEMQLEREGLSRPQIELVAARTSSLNDCFY